MQWIADFLTALRSAIESLEWKCRLRLWPSRGPVRAEFAHGEIRVLMSGPYVCCHHELEIQARVTTDKWLTIGFVSEADLLDAIYCLQDAYSHLWRARSLEQSRVRDDSRLVGDE